MARFVLVLIIALSAVGGLASAAGPKPGRDEILAGLQTLIATAPKPGETNRIEGMPPEKKAALFQALDELAEKKDRELIEALVRFQAADPNPKFPASAIVLGRFFAFHGGLVVEEIKALPADQATEVMPFLQVGWKHAIKGLATGDPKRMSRNKQIADLDKFVRESAGLPARQRAPSKEAKTKTSEISGSTHRPQ